MFDNPNKELQRLQNRLLAAEEEDWQQTDDDPDAALEEVKKILARDDWEEQHREPLSRNYTQAKPVPAKAEAPRKKTPPAPQKAEDSRKKGYTGGLILALVLESLALIAVAVWWLLWR